MGSQFETLAKAPARGATRRWLLLGAAGGLIGAVTATIVGDSRPQIVEAGSPSAVPAFAQSAIDVNQAGSPLYQSGSLPKPQPKPRPRPDQSTAQLNQARATLNQARARWDQRRGRTGQRQWSMNQHRPRSNQTRRPLNAQDLAINQRGRPSVNEERLNEIRARFNQSLPLVNRRKRPNANRPGSPPR